MRTGQGKAWHTVVALKIFMELWGLWCFTAVKACSFQTSHLCFCSTDWPKPLKLPWNLPAQPTGLSSEQWGTGHDPTSPLNCELVRPGKLRPRVRSRTPIIFSIAQAALWPWFHVIFLSIGQSFVICTICTHIPGNNCLYRLMNLWDGLYMEPN